MSEIADDSAVTRLREQLLLSLTRIRELEQDLSAAEQRIGQERRLADEAQRLADRHLEAAMNAAELAAINTRLLELDRERKAMQSSRSWRWTAPIRSVERWLSRPK